MRGFVLVGHGNLPVAMLEAVKMMAGDVDNVYAIGLLAEEGMEDISQKLMSIQTELETYDSVIVFSDLFGGTPSNTALKLFSKNELFTFISGMNFPMVLTAVLTPNIEINDIINTGKIEIKDALVKQNDLVVNQKKEEKKGSTKEKMVLKHVRVDARGIHGQVATAWIPHLKVNRIIVIDDVTINDPTQKIALKMARPERTKLSILSTDTAISFLNDPYHYANESVLVLIQRIETLKTLMEKGFTFNQINLGNVPARADTTKYRKTIHLTEDEINVVKQLIDKDTHVTAQMVPNEAIFEFKEVL